MISLKDNSEISEGLISEWQNLAFLTMYGQGQLSEDQIYQAAVAITNSGGELDLKKLSLSLNHKALISIRKKLYEGLFEEITVQLDTIEKGLDGNIILLGDVSFLRATISFRLGKHEEASLGYRKASDMYLYAGSIYRQLRSLINSEIVKRDFQGYFSGPMKSLEQLCRSNQLASLVGLIERGKTIELMNQNFFSAAQLAAKRSRECYEQDGCPQDYAITLYLLAINELLMGNRKEALSVISEIKVGGFKTKYYREIFESLKLGRIPKVSQMSPLGKVEWKLNGIIAPKNSILGKIIDRLLCGPTKKDELIDYIWGEKATHPSYEHRLHASITNIRKKYEIIIYFDGEFYTLQS